MGFRFLGRYLAFTRSFILNLVPPKTSYSCQEMERLQPSKAVLPDMLTHAGTPKAWCVPKCC